MLGLNGRVGFGGGAFELHGDFGSVVGRSGRLGIRRQYARPHHIGGHCGTKSGRCETSDHSLSHELGSEGVSERANK